MEPDAPTGHRRKLALLAAGSLSLLLAAALGATQYGSYKVKQRLQRMADSAGLKLDVRDISVSLAGEVQVAGARFRRHTGEDIVAVDLAIGTLSPLSAIRGRRRPETLVVKGLRVEVRVVDGKPIEMLDLYRAARGSTSAEPRTEARQAKRRERTALTVEDGDFTLVMTGKGAEALPAGLAVRGLSMRFDPARGVGEISATVHGSQRSQLAAQLHPATKDSPARIEARLSPQLRVNLPTNNPLAKWIDAVVIRGFGYDGETGPSIDGIELLRNDTQILTVERVTSDSQAQLGAQAHGIKFHASSDLLAMAWGSASSTRPGAPGSQRPPSVKGKRRSRKSKRRDTRKRTRALGKRPRPRKRVPTPNKRAKKLRPDTGPQLHPLLAEGLSGTIKSAAIGTNDLLRAQTARARLEELHLPLPGGIGAAGVASMTVAFSLEPPKQEAASKTSRSMKDALRSVEINGPFLDLIHRAETLAKLPGGSVAFGAITRARAGPVAREMTENVDEAKAAGLPPEAQTSTKKKRRKKARKAYTKRFIGPLRALHSRLTSVPSRLDRLLQRLDAVARLKVDVQNGRVGLKDPVAKTPFTGLQDLTVNLTAKLSDGTRGFEFKAAPFSDQTKLGTVSIDLTTAPDGRLDRLKTQMQGPSFARFVAAVGATASVKDDAELSIDTTLQHGKEGGLVVDFAVKTKHIGLNWWRLAPRPIDDFALAAKAKLVASSKPAVFRLTASELAFGEAKAEFLAEVTDMSATEATARLKLSLPKQDCGLIASSIPASMMPTIGTIEADGQLGLTFDMTMPLHKPYRGKLDASLDDSDCTVTQFGNVDVTELARPFKRPVNESGTILEDQLIGPKSDAWVDLAQLPPWVPYAMIATEDAAFYHHRGVRLGLLGRAIKMCLDHGRFVYGGSTITQQLIKNIYLTRDKNLARKFEELLIVWQIERSLMDKRKGLEDEDRFVATKDRLLELYINGIEFGPKLYGITRASREYFDKEASALSPLEAAFLAANKPCPKCGHKRFTTRKWTPWWQERMVSIMSKMRRDDIITDDDFAAEAPYVPRFRGWPNSKRQQPGSTIGGVEE